MIVIVYLNLRIVSGYEAIVTIKRCGSKFFYQIIFKWHENIFTVFDSCWGSLCQEHLGYQEQCLETGSCCWEESEERILIHDDTACWSLVRDQHLYGVLHSVDQTLYTHQQDYCGDLEEDTVMKSCFDELRIELIKFCIGTIVTWHCGGRKV